MGDIETLILVATALAGFGAVVQHFYDRFSENGLYNRSSRSAAQAVESLRAMPTQMGLEVENALQRVAASQEAKYAQAAASAEKSVEMSMVRGVRSLKDVQTKVDNAMAEAILGPALPILRQFAPGLADTLEENPQLIGVIIENPLFKKYIEPRIQQFLGKQPSESTGDNPFLKGLNP